MATLNCIEDVIRHNDKWCVQRDDGSNYRVFDSFEEAQIYYNYLQSLDNQDRIVKQNDQIISYLSPKKKAHSSDYEDYEDYEEEEKERKRKRWEAEKKLNTWKRNELPKLEQQLVTNPQYKNKSEYLQVAKYTKRLDVLKILSTSSNEDIATEVCHNPNTPYKLAIKAGNRAGNLSYKKEQIEEYGKIGYAATELFGCAVRLVVISVIVGLIYLIVSAVI